MAYYYVKSGGTATGDAGRTTTARTGSFATMGASAYYDSVYDLFAGAVPTTIPDGDEILISSVHTEGSNGALGLVNPTNFAVTKLVCVDDSNVETRKKATANTFDFTAADNWSTYNEDNNEFAFYGLVINSTAQINYNARGTFSFYDCDITCTAHIYSITTIANYYNCNIDITYFRCNTTSIYGGTLITSASNYVFYNYISSVYGCDCSGSLSLKVSYNAEVTMERCKVPIAWINSPIYITNRYGVKYNSVSADDSYSYSSNHGLYGDATTDYTNYLNATYDGTNGFSYLFDTSTKTSDPTPLRFKIFSKPSKDLESNTYYTVNFTSDETLTKSNFWLELVRNDATDLALGVIETTKSTTATEHDTNSESWQGGGTNTYEVTVEVTGMTGVDNGLIEVWAYVSEDSISVWVDPMVVIT